MLTALPDRPAVRHLAATLRHGVRRFPPGGAGHCRAASWRCRPRRRRRRRSGCVHRARLRPAEHRRRAAHGRDGPGHRLLRRRRRAGLHDLQGAAVRGRARRRVAASGRRDCSPSRISGSTTHPASTGAHRSARCSPTCARAGWRRAAARSPSSSRARASSRSTRPTRRKVQEVLLALRIEQQYTEGRDPRAVPEQDVLRRRPLRRRGRARWATSASRRASSPCAEAALLAGLVKSPSTWAPTVNLERAVARRNVVLAGDARRRRHRRAPRFEARQGQAVTLQRCAAQRRAVRPYFKEQVRLELVERFGWERVYQSGLRVYTTIDVEMQKAAEAAVAKSLDDLERAGASAALKARKRADRRPTTRRCRPRSSPSTRAPGTCGRWSAAAASTRATSTAPCRRKRQPGSAFKPFVYAAALEAGYTPATLIDRPRRADRHAAGRVDARRRALDGATELTMRAALRTSSNRAAVRMLEMVGVPDGGRLRQASSGSATCRRCRRSRSAPAR